MEEEKEGCLPFLDTEVIRSESQTLSTRWYAKPIASGRLLSYHSFHPLSMKVNVAANFIHRVLSLTSDHDLPQCKHIIHRHLQKNNYPTTLINRLINRQGSRADQTTTLPSIIEHEHTQLAPEIMFRSMPNIPNLSNTICSILKKEYPTVKISLRPLRTTKSILRPVKDPVDPQQQYNVVYSIPCADCQMIYIGMTRNQLRTRISGHRSNINKHASTNNQNVNNETALIQHIANTQHSFNLGETKIIDRSFRTTALPILEMCHISNTANTVNYRTDVDNLSTTYASILHTYKNTLSLGEIKQ